MRIGVLFNCQVGGIAASLQALLPDKSARAAARATLETCDHVICWDAAPRDEVLGPAVLRRVVRNLHLLPSLQFAGYHPDMLFVMLERGRLRGPTEYNQSRIAIAAYLGGVSIDETVELYHALAFARLGYFAAFTEQCALVREDFARRGVAADNLVARLTAGGCFMHSFNHPKIGALLEVARAACEAIGATPAALTKADAAALPDALAPLASHPVYPEIAARLGIAPEGSFHARAAGETAAAAIPLRDFVAGSFARFARVPRAALLEADRVRAAMMALGLRDRAAIPAAPPGRADPRAAILAWARAQITADREPAAEPPAWFNPGTLAAIEPDAVATLRTNLAAMPADRLATRGGAAPAHAAGARLLLLPEPPQSIANAGQLAALATRRGFAVHAAAALTAASLVSLLRAADVVIIPGNHLMAYLLFCAPGTRVIEITAPAGPRLMQTALCARLGLAHSVVACAAPQHPGPALLDIAQLRRALRPLAQHKLAWDGAA